MKAVIIGCGRVGATIAATLDAAGHEVIILDLRPAAFDRLPHTFHGSAVRGDGTDEDVLRRAGAEGADIVLAMTEGDNRNVIATQLAREALDAKQVVAKINDPVRAVAYADLGLATVCRTSLQADAVLRHLGFPESGMPDVLTPRGSQQTGQLQAGATAAAPANLPAATPEQPTPDEPRPDQPRPGGPATGLEA
jgi:trk/ktr system potassium uptake protein